MSHIPKISVVMPAYNAEKYIGEAIESILHQTFSDFECIIIDDGSTDRTWETIQEYTQKDERIVGVKNGKNIQISATLNKGVGMAKWEYIARMDADDISMPERFAKQVAFLDANPDVGIVWWSMQLFNEKGVIWTRQYYLTDLEIRKHLFFFSPFCHPSIMMRAELVRMVWWYGLDMVYAEDYDLYFKLGTKTQFANLSETVLQYRVSGAWITVSRLREMEKKTMLVRKKAVEEYWYSMRLVDKAYLFLQKLSAFLVRGNARIYLFQLLRDKKI